MGDTEAPPITLIARVTPGSKFLTQALLNTVLVAITAIDAKVVSHGFTQTTSPIIELSVAIFASENLSQMLTARIEALKGKTAIL